MMTAKQHNKEKESEKRVSEMLNTAFGPTINTLLDDPTVTNIRLNPNGKLFYKKLKEGKFLSEESISKQSAEQIIRIVASSRGEICDSKNPIISSELPVTGYRFQGMLPPAVERASFAIRKKALLVYTLDDYVDQGILKPEWSQFIKTSIKEKKNILIVGGPILVRQRLQTPYCLKSPHTMTPFLSLKTHTNCNVMEMMLLYLGLVMGLLTCRLF